MGEGDQPDRKPEGSVRRLGYEQSDRSDTEVGYQRVALYEVNGEMKHAALQMPNGRWRSKIGKGPVIEDSSPELLADGIYGTPTTIMRRAT